MNNIKFGMNIAHLRKEKNLTQKELANKLNVTDKAVSRWERGVGFPDISTLCPLAEALGVSVSKLLDAEDFVEKEIENNLLQINGILATKDLKKSKIFLFLTSLILIMVLIFTTLFGIKYYKWNYENTIVADGNRFFLEGEVRLKKVRSYELIGDGMYKIGEDIYIIVDVIENYE